METLQAIAKRCSTRGFSPEKKVEPEILGIILATGCAAPVGAASRASLHLTVVQAPELLAAINKASQKKFKAEQDFLYGAPVVVIVSSSENKMFQSIPYANVACVVENMLIAATDAGVDNLYLWGSITALAEDSNLCAQLGIPEGFTPLSAAALGYGTEQTNVERELSISIATNYV